MAVAQTLPSSNADGSAIVTPSRTGKYLEAYTVPVGRARDMLALEGSYYTAMNATDDTQLTAHAAPAIADAGTKPIIHFYNGGTKTVALDYISLYTIVANASASRVFFDAYVNSSGSTVRTSGGTAITLANNNNAASSNTTGLTIYAGAVVTTATSLRKVFHSMVRPAIGIALDQYHFSFGQGLGMSQGAFVQATVQSTYSAGSPIIVAPGGNFLFEQISPSGAATAMTFEFQMGWSER